MIKFIYFIHKNIYITSIILISQKQTTRTSSIHLNTYLPQHEKKVLLDTTYKHARTLSLSLSLFLLHSRYVYVERLFVFTCSDLIGASSSFIHTPNLTGTEDDGRTIIVAEKRQKLPQFLYDI